MRPSVKPLSPWPPPILEPQDRTGPRRRARRTVLIVALVPVGWLLVLSPFLLFIALRDLGQPDPVTPDRSAIVGTWTNPDGARLVFRADGTFSASGMPYVSNGEGDGFDYDVLPVDGTGTWSISRWDDRSGSGGGVYLTGAGGSFLDTAGKAASPSLFATIGDPDEGNDFSFTKQPD